MSQADQDPHPNANEPTPAATHPATGDPATDQPGALGAAPSQPAPFPIVGIGASAGGLQAFEALFSAFPRDHPTGMAFVVVQHLAPDHKSMLADLVRRYTRMRVREVEDRMMIEPDCVYIIPPKSDLACFKGVLHLFEPQTSGGLRLPIDFFFRSLADDQHERAIGIVLSGSGSDGTLGARALKGEGGLVIVQSPTSAAYDSMPRSVIATGLADLVLAPAEMPERLLAYIAHAFGRKGASQTLLTEREDSLTKICLLLRDATRHDFSNYKQSTLVRRIERRMALHQIERQSDYVRYLQREPDEIQWLFRDLLIGVTSFFRDPDAFAGLQAEVIPRLFAGKAAGSRVRIWVCGCSTGEEAYSIAILVQEYLESVQERFQVQLFATDIDAKAIEQARAGLYPASIAADVSPQRLQRYFTLDPDTGVYRIQKVIRDLLVFSEQDLIRDPPFSRIDFVSCRNLLIYLDVDLQRRIIPLFHYALNPDGMLFLGSAETVGDALRLFSCLNRKWRLYLRLDEEVGLPAAPTLGDLSRAHPPFPQQSVASGATESRPAGRDLRGFTEGALLAHLNAVGVLVNSIGEIAYIHGRTGLYLEPAVGAATMNIFQMAREGLRRPLTSAVQRAVGRQEMVRTPRLKVKTNGDYTFVSLSVRPAPLAAESGSRDGRASFYLVAFEQLPTSAEDAEALNADAPNAAPPDPARRIAELEQDLRAKDEYLQTTLEEMETSNEELKSTNEEMQSVNEELQSTNEELETSKEELQSVNEELATVNAELQVKVTDLSRANDDMNNLLAGTGVATLFIDEQQRISRFTPAMTQIIKLIPSDIGRPVGDIVSNLVGDNDLIVDIETVLRTLVPQEKAVQTSDGTWFLMRIGPYRTLANVIEGVVMTFVDISSRRRMEEELRNARELTERVIDAVREPLAVLDANAVLVSANAAFFRQFQLVGGDSRGKSLFSLCDGLWDHPGLRQRLAELTSTQASVDDYRLECDSPQLGARVLRVNARRLSPVGEQAGAILIACEDLDAAATPVRESDDASG